MPITPPHRHPAPTGATRGIVTPRLVAVALSLPLLGLGLIAPAQAAQPARPDSLPAGTSFYVDPGSQVVQWANANPGDSRQPVIASKIAGQPEATWFATYDPDTITSDVRTVASAAAGGAQRPALRVAPLLVGGGAVAVAAGIDDRVEAGVADVGQYGLVVGDLGGGGLEVGDVGEDAVAVGRHARGRQAGGLVGGVVPVGVPRVVVHPGGRVGGVDRRSRLRERGVAVGESLRVQAVGGGERVRLQDDHRGTAAQAGREPLDPGRVARRVRRPARGEAAAVAVGYLVRHEHRDRAAPPTTATGDAQIDAYLWIKDPGESDGCADAAGTFDPGLAYALATG